MPFPRRLLFIFSLLSFTGRLHVLAAEPGAALDDLVVVRGGDLLQEGELDEAARVLIGFLADHPRAAIRPQVSYLLAHAELGRGNWAEAARLLLPLEDELKPLGDYVLFYRGIAFFRAREPERALRSFERLLTLYPESRLHLEAKLRLGDALSALGRDEEAFLVYQSLLPHHSRSRRAEITFLMAESAGRAGSWSRAGRLYQRIWLREPTEPVARLAEQGMRRARRWGGRWRRASLDERHQRALLLLRRGWKNSALAELRDLEEEGRREGAPPDLLFDLRLAVGRCYLRKRWFKTAAAIFGELYRRNPTHPRAAEPLYHLARTLAKRDRYARAIEYYLRLQRDFPRHRKADTALFTAAWLHYDEGDFTEAESLFRRLLKTYPRSDLKEEALWYLGWSAYRSGEMRKASRAFATPAKSSDDTLAARATYWRSRVLARLGDWEEAIRGYRRLIEKWPVDYFAWLTRSRVAELHGSLVSGKARSERPKIVQEGAPSHPRGPHLHRALALLALGFLEDGAAEIHAAEAAGEWGSGALLTLGSFYQEARGYYDAFRLWRDHLHYRTDPDPDGSPGSIWRLGFPRAYPEIVWSAGRKRGVDPLLLLAVMREESRYQPEVVSWANAVGLMQVIPPTGERIAEELGLEEFGEEMLLDPRVSIRFGAWYLGRLLNEFHGQVPLAVGAYNAGPHAMKRWLRRRGGLAMDEFIESVPYKETRNYIKRVLASYGVYLALYVRDGAGLTLPLHLDPSFENRVDF